jgi:SAM-dependent methyltransferase
LPPASPADLAAFYPDGYGPYGEQPGGLQRLISRAIRAFQGANAGRHPPLKSMAALPAGSGLDVGCGRGDLAGWFVDRGWRMSAVEPSPGAAAAARARGVDVSEGVLATVPLEGEAYDAVVFQQSLEHTEEPQADLERVFAALRPGGIVCISVPNFGSWQARRFRTSWFHLDVPRHRTHFTASSLARALEAAGFVAVETSTSTSPVGLPASIQYRLAGRCLFPEGLRLRVAAGLCVFTLPISWALDRVGGGGDMLHAVAAKPPARQAR